jgi:hypothetical protein
MAVKIRERREDLPQTIGSGYFEAANPDRRAANALREYGLAMFASQVLEERIGILLRLRHERGSMKAQNEYRELLGKRPGATLGALVRVLKREIGEESARSAAERFAAALAARNFIAHHYFRLNWPEFLSADGLKRAEVRLRRQREALENGLRALAELESRLGEAFMAEARVFLGNLVLRDG